MAVRATCPGCGAEVVFVTGAPLLVCAHCSSVVARGDRDVENLGKVVDLVDTRSPLELLREGSYRGARFTLVGRSQLAHAKGGVWDEWYATFDDGRWGWLAEAEGRFYMTFEVPGGASELPPYARITVGKYVPGMHGAEAYVAVEKGVATRRSAAGEIPFRFQPGEAVHFVDLSGPAGAFATLDYGAGEPTPHLHVGREVTLAELGWANLAPREVEHATVAAVRVSCPECDGALELRAPDATQRVGCPYCGALLDADHGKLKKLRQLARPRFQPVLPLGARGRLEGGDFVVIGFVRKATHVEGIQYTWDEFLLHDPKLGFRWLVLANGHWSFVTPIAAGQASTRGFTRFQAGPARIEHVLGELTWKAKPGDHTQTEDWIAPPRMLSIERDGHEINHSLGVYKSPREIAAAFGLELDALPAPMGRAPHQPYPHTRVFKSFAWLLGAWLVVTILVGLRGQSEVLAKRIHVERSPGATGAAQVWFSEPFALSGRRNVGIHLWASVDQSWVYVEGDLVNEETGLVQGFDAAIEHYSGVEGGESWSEGAKDKDVYLSALPAGLYVLRLEIQSGGGVFPPTLEVKVRQGVHRWTHNLLALLGVSLLPGLLFWHRHAFEKQRWADSNLGDDD